MPITDDVIAALHFRLLGEFTGLEAASYARLTAQPSPSRSAALQKRDDSGAMMLR